MSNCHLCARLPISREVGVEAFLQQRVNAILKNPSQIDEVFFKVVKQTNCIQEGAVVHLSAKLNSLALRVYVGYRTDKFTLPVMPLTLLVRKICAFIFGNNFFLPVM